MFFIIKYGMSSVSGNMLILWYFYLLMTVLLNNVCFAGTGTWTSQQIEVAVRREGCHTAEGPYFEKSLGRHAFSDKPYGRHAFS